MSDSVRPHRRQPTRLPRSWDSPGKNTGVGCHFLLQCMKVKIEVAQSCLTLSDPVDCSLLGASIHGISRQEYWSGVPLPSPIFFLRALENRILISTIFFFSREIIQVSANLYFRLLWPEVIKAGLGSFTEHISSLS